MLNRDPPDHTRLRTLVSKAFTPRRIEQFRTRIQGICDGLLAAARPGDFDLVRDYALPIPLTVISRLRDLLACAVATRYTASTRSRGQVNAAGPSPRRYRGHSKARGHR
jgi:cytochrome P450